MFNHRHYVPILRWKSAELAALLKLLPEDGELITPLIELCPNILELNKQKRISINKTEDYFQIIAQKIGAHWGFASFFADVELIENLLPVPTGKHAISLFFDAARAFRLRAIPVSGLLRSAPYQAAVASAVGTDRRGVCFRLLESELRNPRLQKDLENLMIRLRVSPSEVDILIDLKIISEASMSLEAICYRLPFLPEWRSFTVASGAFPKDLSDFEKNEQHELPRLDWRHWREAVAAGSTLLRRSAFGDYTVQFPRYEPPPDFPNTSASIRYAAENHWVIMRGEGVRNPNGSGYAQYPGQAYLLCERSEFAGKDYCYGDEYIYRMGQQTTKPGNARTWIEAAINRHLTLTARQIANLFDPSTGGGLGRELPPRSPLPRVWRKRMPVTLNAHLQQPLFLPRD